MQFGLKTEVIEAIQQVLEQNPRVDKALVFGSRAKGNYKEGSDIDLALKGDITAKDLLDLHGKLDALNLPYSFDLVNYNTINEPDLKEHIDRAGVEMYSRWKRYQLQNLGIIVTGKTPSSNFPDEFGDKMPFVTPTDYKNYNKWISITERSLSEKGVLKLKNKILPANSVLVTCIGSDMGKVAMNKIPVITNQQINSIIPNESVNANFLYYKLVNSYDELRTYGEAGTAVPILNKGDFEKITIEIPINKKEQEILANVLISFDDKINRLHSQNKTIEQLAETLFRQWFVEEVDESWKEEVLDKFISFDPKEKIDRNEKYRFFDMKCLSEVGMHISEGIYRNVSPASSFRNFDTLLAKITPCLENGKTGFVMHLDEGEVARGSTEFIVMRSKGLVSPYWIYCLARDSDFREKAIQSMTGTSGRQRVQIDSLRNMKVRLNIKRMVEFHEAVSPFFSKIKSNQTQTLSQLRDVLLPKLMNGEIRVEIDKN